VEFGAGDTVTEEGTPGGRFYVIESGAAEVLVRGRKRAAMGPRDAFGEISLVDGGPRAATVVAAEPMRCYAIAEWNFRSLLKSNASIAYKVALVLCRRLRDRQALDATC
jgi:CRP-like cAMP-binding protein